MCVNHVIASAGYYCREGGLANVFSGLYALLISSGGMRDQI